MFTRARETGVWKYRIDHHEESLIFDRVMLSFVPSVAATVLGSCDFSRLDVVMDVGGGQGVLLVAILPRNPLQRGILFE